MARDTFVMAVGTSLSRLTGLLRLVALVYAVHFRAVGDAYNLSNTLPNVVHDIVLGGILSATFVPVFVARLASAPEGEAWDAISAICSVTAILIALSSIAFLVASPLIIDVITAFGHGSGVATERHVATELLVLFVPQLAAYGFVSLATALLNARRSFAAPMFAPIVNNLVTIVFLYAFGVVVAQPTLSGLEHHHGELLLLGMGTTLGVMVQALALVPSLRRAGLRLRWYPRMGHEAVRNVLRLSGWTFGLVAGNQLALVVVLALSVHVGPGAVSAYTYAFTFFQLPYGIVAVSLMSAIAPELAEHFTRGNLIAFGRRMSSGLKALLAIMVPAAAGMVVLSHPLLSLLGHAIGDTRQTTLTADALAMLALGLPGFSVFLYAIRVLQSMQDLRSAFWLYAIENGANIVLALLLAGPFGVQGIMLSISVSYTIGALVALRTVRGRIGQMDVGAIAVPLSRVLIASAVLVAAAVVGVNLLASQSAIGLFVRVLAGVVLGAGGYVIAAGVLARLTNPRAIAGSTSHARAGGGGEPGMPVGAANRVQHRTDAVGRDQPQGPDGGKELPDGGKRRPGHGLPSSGAVRVIGPVPTPTAKGSARPRRPEPGGRGSGRLRT